MNSYENLWDEYAEALVNNEGADGLSNKELLAVIKSNLKLKLAVQNNIADRWDVTRANEIFGEV